MAKYYATKTNAVSHRERRNLSRVRNIAPQGMVLLKNDGLLPLRKSPKKVALYGKGARRTIKGGTGSGDVNSREVISIEEGLQRAGIEVLSSTWMDIYDSLCEKHMGEHMMKIQDILAKEGAAGIGKIIEIPYQEPEEPEILETELDNEADLVIYVISRNSGEGKDRKAEKGDYELSDIEIKNLKMLANHFEQVLVILNVGGVIDIAPICEIKNVKSILLMSQAGNVGGLVIADILQGVSYPSGHLAATWAKKYADYPSADTFSYRNGNTDDEYYEDGIYVGYRYFDSFGVTPAYPFGFGLSYTNFELSSSNIRIEKEHICVSVDVKNIGTYKGRELVQVYYSAPAGKLCKAYQELAGYKKTKELQPGETERIEIQFAVTDLASYDESIAGYVIEKGEYVIRVGVNAKDTKAIVSLCVDRNVVTAQLSNRVCADCKIKELSANLENSENELLKMDLILQDGELDINTQKEKEFHHDLSIRQEITLDDVKNKKITLNEFVNALDVTELASLCVGSSRGGFGSVSIIGAASSLCPGAAGDTTSELIETRKVANMVFADGPAGLRLSKHFVTDEDGNLLPGLGESALGGIEALLGMQIPERPENAIDYYQYCTAIPIATLLAQTWDEAVIEEAGDIVGEEMEELGIHLWLAPGMNIQRNPLCGRNFEYYSEDPFVSGKCAAAMTRGVQKHNGRGTCIKHFALNNQEDNRSHLNVHASERAIREIYLKGFEIAIKESKPLSLMSSYNLLNGIHTANNKELLTSICRNEWGYEGLIMTDWGTTGGGAIGPEFDKKYGFSSATECIRAGNDLIMPGSQQDYDDIVAGINRADGTLLLEELRSCAKRVLRTILITEGYESYE